MQPDAMQARWSWLRRKCYTLLIIHIAFDHKNEKNLFLILYCARLIVTLAAPKLLTLDHKNEKNLFSFCIVLA